MLKDAIRTSKLWQTVGLPIRSRLEIRRWLDDGRPSPPTHAIMARNLMVMADLFGLDTLVETGTF